MRFINNEFPLSGLEMLDGLNGKYFKELDKPLQKKYGNLDISTVVFKKVSYDQKRDLFLRFNQRFH